MLRLQLLLDEGVDIDTARDNGETALHLAVRESNIDTVEVTPKRQAVSITHLATSHVLLVPTREGSRRERA